MLKGEDPEGPLLIPRGKSRVFLLPLPAKRVGEGFLHMGPAALGEEGELNKELELFAERVVEVRSRDKGGMIGEEVEKGKGGDGGGEGEAVGDEDRDLEEGEGEE